VSFFAGLTMRISRFIPETSLLPQKRTCGVSNLFHWIFLLSFSKM
jgi:hypothetical protein